ncbi:hypothetical protein F5887DRAFT_919499 [Amanita rubescens]|nr:hypothetical protein F5887DRAFT_920998 [Amanita rubescens]KAF8340241.1 hypothetical protein F5887DRAFT_919499 [Amanita rubescens]
MTKRIFAFISRHPSHRLRKSESNEAVKVVRAAVEKYQEQSKRARNVADWVIMGPSHPSRRSDKVPHWTVRGLSNGRPRLTIHAYADGRQARWWPNGGRRQWKKSDLQERCRLLYEKKGKKGIREKRGGKRGSGGE